MSTIQGRVRTRHLAPLAAMSMLLVVSAAAALAQPHPPSVESVSNALDACPNQPMAVAGERQTALRMAHRSSTGLATLRAASASACV
jgi:hypothetical protein